MKQLLSLALVFGGIACNPYAALADEARTSVDEMKTTGDIQGLYEIREAAREFMAAQNRRNKTNWRAQEPDLRVLVPRCLVPLKVR